MIFGDVVHVDEWIQDLKGVICRFSVEVDVEYEEVEFVWDDYLEDCKATAVPATSFKHVRLSLIFFLLTFIVIVLMYIFFQDFFLLLYAIALFCQSSPLLP